MGTNAESEPAALLQSWIEAVDRGDVESALAVLEDNAIIDGLGLCAQQLCAGKQAIRREIERAIASGSQHRIKDVVANDSACATAWLEHRNAGCIAAGIDRFIVISRLETKDGRIVAIRRAFDMSDEQTRTYAAFQGAGIADVPYGLEGFVQDLDRIIERAHQDRQLVQGATSAMQRLLADMRWLEPPYWQTDYGDHAQYLLRRHPAGAYVILSVVFPEGYSTPVHDHGAWGVVGVWRGAEREERFKRVDNLERADYAELRSASTVVNTPGSVTWLRPPNEDIHRISNVAPYPSSSIHVYGGTLNRRRYDLETGRVTQWPVQLKSLAEQGS